MRKAGGPIRTDQPQIFLRCGFALKIKLFASTPSGRKDMNRFAACCCILAAVVSNHALADLGSGLKAMELSNYALAMKELKPFAEQGNPQAQAALGKMYLFGWGVEKNEKEAVIWLRKAAEQGDAWSQRKLVYAYERGVGVEKNPAEAERWRQGTPVKQTPAPVKPAVPEKPNLVFAGKSPREGYAISRATAEQLEKRVSAKPDDLVARTVLLGYYFANAGKSISFADAIEARRRHIFWLIRNHPDIPLAGSSEATLDPKGHKLADQVGYEAAKKLWLEQPQKTHPKPGLVIANAARFLQLHDKALAEELLLRGQALNQTDREWSAFLGYLYALGIMGIDGLTQNGLPFSVDTAQAAGAFAQKARQALDTSSDAVLVGTAGKLLGEYGSMLKAFGLTKTDQDVLAERCLQKAHALEPDNSAWPSLLGQFYRLQYIKAATPDTRRNSAIKALGYMEQALASTRGDDWRSSELSDMAKLAFEAGEIDKARTYADQLLAIAAQHGNETKFGPNIHDANMILGRVALRQGNREEAKAYLLKAGKTPGGGTLTSFGPNMSLAKDLLEAGEQEVVLQYLELCKSFWGYPKGPLEKWIATIKAGKTPEFGANLNY